MTSPKRHNFWVWMNETEAVNDSMDDVHSNKMYNHVQSLIPSFGVHVQSKQNWNVTVYHDEWIRGVTAGGCGNPPDQRECCLRPLSDSSLRPLSDPSVLCLIPPSCVFSLHPVSDPSILCLPDPSILCLHPVYPVHCISCVSCSLCFLSLHPVCAVQC